MDDSVARVATARERLVNLTRRVLMRGVQTNGPLTRKERNELHEIMMEIESAMAIRAEQLRFVAEELQKPPLKLVYSRSWQESITV